MSKSVQFSMTISVTGDGLSTMTFAPTYSNTNGFGAQGPQALTLSAGFNALTAPTNASQPPTMVVLIPASTSTNTKTVKGITGDTGPSANTWTNQPLILNCGTASTWGITSTAGETIQIMYF